MSMMVSIISIVSIIISTIIISIILRICSPGSRKWTNFTASVGTHEPTDIVLKKGKHFKKGTRQKKEKQTDIVEL